MAKTLFISLLLCSTIAVNAQIADSIIGKWKYKEMRILNQLDSNSLEILKKIFEQITIDFKPDKHYLKQLFGKEEGIWAYDSTSKELTLAGSNGTETKVKLSMLTKETLLLDFGNDQLIVMQKENKEREDIKQIYKTWYLKSKSHLNKSTGITELEFGIFKGSFFKFNEDKTFNFNLSKTNETGTWHLENDNRKIICNTNNENKFWTIVSLTESELVLIKDNTNETWTFSTNL